MHKMNEPKNDSLGNQIVTEALEWLGTPWFHGQSLKGIGTDCVGFIAGVGIKVGFLPHNFILENYERIPRNNFLVRFIESILTRVEGSPDKGDVLVFRKSGINGHVGIYLGDGEYIHADSINGVIKTYIYECPPVLVYRVPVSGVVKS